jgi:hypothetical protein
LLIYEELFQIGRSCLQENDLNKNGWKNMFENTLCSLVFDSNMGFGPENFNGTWAERKANKRCATERMWDRTFRFLKQKIWTTHGCNMVQRGKKMGQWKHTHGSNKGKKWATESMWERTSGFLIREI